MNLSRAMVEPVKQKTNKKLDWKNEIYNIVEPEADLEE